MADDRTLHEAHLRELLDDASKPATLDVDRVLRRTRARRAPKLIATSAIGALALTGIIVVGVQSLPQTTSTGTFSESSIAEDQSAPEPEGTRDTPLGVSGGTMSDRAPADRVNLCEGPLAEVASHSAGLVAEAQFDAAPADGSPIEGIVRLTNTGTEPVTGYTPAVAAVTLSQDGTVLWHSSGPMILSLTTVDLAPGESLDYAASVTPVRCEVQDDTDGFRENLPALPAGTYEVSAILDFTADDATAPEFVTGPLTPLELR